jgi:hypothetical protein
MPSGSHDLLKKKCTGISVVYPCGDDKSKNLAIRDSNMHGASTYRCIYGQIKPNCLEIKHARVEKIDGKEYCVCHDN